MRWWTKSIRLSRVEEIMKGRGRGRRGRKMRGKMGMKAKDVYVTQFSDRSAPGGRFPFFTIPPRYAYFISLYIYISQ